MSRNGARWLRAKGCSRPLAVGCRCAQNPPTVDQHIQPWVSMEKGAGEAAHLGLGAHVGRERVDGLVSGRGADIGRGLFGTDQIATRDADPGPIVASPIAVGLPIPQVAPVTSTTLPAIGSASDMVHDLSSRVPRSDVIHRSGGLAQGVGSIECWA